MTDKEKIQLLRRAALAFRAIFGEDELQAHAEYAAFPEHDRENCALCLAERAIKVTE